MPFRILWWKSRPLGLRYLALKRMGFSPGGETPYLKQALEKRGEALNSQSSPRKARRKAESAGRLVEFQKGICPGTRFGK
jgi:hypothetical protein